MRKFWMPLRLGMSKGAGASIEDILKETQRTTGAFWHRFTGKLDLARQLLERYAFEALKIFGAFVDEAEAKYEDSLEPTIASPVMFEESFGNSTEPAPCLQ